MSTQAINPTFSESLASKFVVAMLIVAICVATLVLHPLSAFLVLAAAVWTATLCVRPDLTLWVVLLLTPIETLGPVGFVTTKTVKLALTSVSGGWLWWRFRDGGSSVSSKDLYRWPFFLIVFSGLCSSLLAKSPWTSMAGMGSTFVFVLLYTAVRKSGALSDRAPRLLRTVMCTGILASLLCAAQLLFGYEGILGSPEQRAMQAEGVMDTFWPLIERGSATFNGPSAAGAFVAMTAVIAVTHAAVFKASRAKYLVTALVCVIGVLATFSRGALLGLLVGSAFAFWTMGLLSKRRLWILAGVAAMALAAVFFSEQARNYLRLGTDVVSVSESRVDAWQASGVILARHPVFGIGFYGFRDAAQGIEGFSDTPLHPHNGFLKALVELGPLGGGAYLMYAVVFLRTARRLGRAAVDEQLRWVHGAVAGAGASLFTQELFDANLTMGGSSIAILFAALLGFQASLCPKDTGGAELIAPSPTAART